jgi:hypothetical protein
LACSVKNCPKRRDASCAVTTSKEARAKEIIRSLSLCPAAASNASVVTVLLAHKSNHRFLDVHFTPHTSQDSEAILVITRCPALLAELDARGSRYHRHNFLISLVQQRRTKLPLPPSCHPHRGKLHTDVAHSSMPQLQFAPRPPRTGRVMHELTGDLLPYHPCPAPTQMGASNRISQVDERQRRVITTGSGGFLCSHW